MVLQYLKRGSNSAFFYGLNSFVTRALSFIFLPYFLSHLSLADFGIWDFYQVFFSTGTVLLTSCAATGMIRFFLLYKDDPAEQKKAIGNSFLIAFLAGVIAPFLLFSFGYIFFKSLMPKMNYLFLTVLNVSLFTFFSMVLAFMRMKEKLFWYTVLFCGQSIVATGVTAWLIFRGCGIASLFYASAVSFLLFLPCFFFLLYRYRAFSWTILKDQAAYSIPVLLYGLMYTGFYSIDRFFITYNSGFEALGTYGLLGRFGAIFQFFAIALFDAWPVILFNAQKEKNGDALIAKLISYFLLTLTTGGLISIVASYWAIHWFFLDKYWYIAQFMALYFLPLVMLEIARVLQVGFALSTKTFFLPLTTLFGLALQTLFLWALGRYQLTGIMIANTGAFFCYAIVGVIMTGKSYSKHVIEVSRIAKVVAVFCVYIAILHRVLMAQNYVQPIFLLLSWPATLWFVGIITRYEKEWIKGKMSNWLFRDKDRTSEEEGVKKILYVRTDIHFQEIKSGGSVAHTIGVIGGFKALGYQIVCASSSVQSTLKNLDLHYFQELKVYPVFGFLRWKFGHLRWRLDCIFSNLFFTLQILPILRRHSVHFLYQRYSILNCTGLILSKLTGIPLVLEHNGSEVLVFNQWSEHRWFKLTRISHFIERLNVKYADHIIAVSQVIKDELVASGVEASKILVNPNGVDPEIFNPNVLTKEREKIREELLIKDKYVFGFVGTFAYWHGIEVLAYMIPRVIKKNKHAHFLLIGDGMLKNYLLHELSKDPEILANVTFTGLVSQSAARNYLAACDAFLCPTQLNRDEKRFFYSPIKMFEYMSLGKPIIASDLEQISELLSPAISNKEINKNSIDQHVGIVVPPEDFDGFCNAADSLIESQGEFLEKMGANARAKVIEKYSWNKHVKNIQSFIGSR
jgi:glycosyltransferase involved in cell wall biosynthesis/O-antigen/teichoic acid export membrane protein